MTIETNAREFKRRCGAEGASEGGSSPPAADDLNPEQGKREYTQINEETA
jgi:hypothetical protein